MKNKIGFLFIFSFLFFGCYNNQGSEQDVMANLSAEEMADIPDGNQIQSKVIKRGYISFETSDLSQTKAFINEQLKKVGGHIASETTSNYDSRENHSLTARIPSKNFDNFIDNLEQTAKNIQSKNISSEDVTSEYVDIDARLKNKKALEERYLELLNQSKNIADILEVERQISQLRGEIESVEGRLKYLNDQIDYSTLEINYYKERAKSLMLGQKLYSGIKNGWNNLMLFIVGLVNVWPFIIIFGVLAWFLLRKRHRKP